LWYEERPDKSRRFKQVDFSICCQKEKVKRPFLKKPPEFHENLLKGEDNTSKHFFT